MKAVQTMWIIYFVESYDWVGGAEAQSCSPAPVAPSPTLTCSATDTEGNGEQVKQSVIRSDAQMAHEERQVLKRRGALVTFQNKTGHNRTKTNLSMVWQIVFILMRLLIEIWFFVFVKYFIV